MKHVFVVVALVLFVSPIFADNDLTPTEYNPSHTLVEVGDVAIVPHDYRVDMMNVDPVQKGDEEVDPPRTCNIEESGMSRVINITSGCLLVRYTPPALTTHRTDACPAGTLYFVDEGTFRLMTALHRSIKGGVCGREREKQFCPSYDEWGREWGRSDCGCFKKVCRLKLSLKYECSLF